MRISKPSGIAPIILWSFILCLAYWAYLFMTTTPLIVHDAISYDDLGRTIHRDGGITFFKGGPQREPLYPLLVSIAMSLADTFSMPYLQIQKLLQIVILLVTQIASLHLLRKLGVKESLIALAMLYIGFSPALVNSALSLFSEIVAYPFILGILFLIIKGWRSSLRDEPVGKIMVTGICLGLLFMAMISAKAIFEFVLPVALLPFLFLTVYSLVKELGFLAERIPLSARSPAPY